MKHENLEGDYDSLRRKLDLLKIKYQAAKRKIKKLQQQKRRTEKKNNKSGECYRGIKKQKFHA